MHATHFKLPMAPAVYCGRPAVCKHVRVAHGGPAVSCALLRAAAASSCWEGWRLTGARRTQRCCHRPWIDALGMSFAVRTFTLAAFSAAITMVDGYPCRTKSQAILHLLAHELMHCIVNALDLANA